jgi:tripartite ATP-independent transporter DctM subunit
MIIIVLIVFLILLFVGVPVAFVLGISSLLYFILTGSLNHLSIITLKIFTGMDNFVLMAIPLFILTGELMNRGGITSKLVELSNMIVGKFRGGLAYVNILGSTFFAGITGSALADVAAIGSMLIPAMEENGYDKEFSTAITAASALQGPIIPPSIPAVLIAAATGISTGALFVGGIIPGLMLGFACCIVTFVLVRKRNYPRNEKKYTLHDVIIIVRETSIALLTPVIILGGILFGIFTPTEAAGVAVLYSVIIIFLGKNKLSFKEIRNILINTVISSAKIYFIIGMASVFAWVLAIENIPTLIAGFITGFSSNKYVILLIINLFLLFWGMWMDTAPSIMILMPLLYPITSRVGIHPVQFGVITIVNLMIGLLTPPFGMVLFSSQAIGKVKMSNLLKELWPFIALDFVILGLITLIPGISLFLPKLFGLI